MKKVFLITGVWAASLVNTAFAGAYSTLWQQVAPNQVISKGERVLQPAAFHAFYLNDAAMKTALSALPEDPAQAQTFDLPTPEGGYRSFHVWQSSVMAKELAAKYPDIRTFTAVATDNKHVTAKLDFSPRGFHAMVYDNGNTYFIDPYSSANDGYYISYYRKDYKRTGAAPVMACELHSNDQILNAGQELRVDDNVPPLQLRVNGDQRKKYRLALACTGEYAAAVGGPTPTTASVLAAMVVSVNRVNGVYEREFAVTMELIAKEDTLIFLNSTTDPYTNNNGSTMLGQNQTTITNRIGSANYDMGHVFSTGGGGIAQLGCICSNNNKARGVTGSANPVGDSYDIDYVAHEMGHQFGGDHTFNANTGSCSGNGVSASAYEPGSGSTIMAYAGICGSTDDLQPHSDPYFHARSLVQITNYITTGNGGTCPAVTSSGNTPAAFPAFSATYSIPFLTPFELTAPVVTDVNHDTLKYCWEEWDLGDFNKTWNQIRLAGPIFRSFNPDTSRTRVFPKMINIINNITSYLGEKLPDTARKLRFKVTARDIYNGMGCINFSDDSIVLNVIYTGTPFRVTNPNLATVTWIGGTTQTVTWDVSSTDAAPISASNVDITLSVDGGYTYPYTLKANAPNNGTATITVPNITTTTKARVKIKGAGNVFFDISNQNFTITHDDNQPWPTAVQQVAANDGVKVYPVPASEVLYVRTETGNNMLINVTNVAGQSVWKGSMSKNLDIPVQSWSKGVYYLQLRDEQSGKQVVRSVIIQ